MAEMTGDKAQTMPNVADKVESRSLIKRANELLKASIKYQKDNNRETLWKELEEKLRGQYYPKGSKRRKVETIASYVYETINTVAPRQPYIKITAKTPKYVTDNGLEVDNVRNARYREGAINQEFSELKVHRQVKKGCRDAYCPFGYGVWKLGWGASTIYDSRGQEQIDEEGLWVKWHPSQDFLAGIFSTDQDDMPYCFWRVFMPYDKAMKEGEKRGWNMDVLRNMPGDTVPKFLYSGQRKDYNAEVKMLEIFEMHDIEEDWIATFTKDGSDFLELPKENPALFKGMHGAVYMPWPLNSEFYGRSQAELIKDHADDINESREQVRNHVKSFPFLLIDDSDNPTENDAIYKYAPYGCKVNMKSGKSKDLQVHKAPALTRDTYMWGDQARQDAQWVLAKSDMSHGHADPDQKATQSSIIAGKENAMTLGMQDDIADVYERLAAKAGDLLVQNVKGEKWFRYQGEMPGDMTAPFESYGFMDIIGDFDHKVDIDTFNSGNNGVKAQVLTNIATQALSPDLGEVSEDLKREYDMKQMFVKAAKWQGVDLEEFRRPQEENAKANDPYEENEHALSGGLLSDPIPGEEVEHLPVHIPVAMATKDEELARHILKHRAQEANSPEGIQKAMQAQAQSGAPQTNPLPLQQGAPQPSGGALVGVKPGGVTQGVARQMNPMR
ncbi:MAG: hypothetical protein KKB59_19240 [Spirochaetes bacterium]|nr:hypothetical protein [Spirochaetota bacterium]